MRAVGTNVLSRALVRDDAAQAARAEAVIGGQAIYIPVTVMLELEWMLRSRYAFPPKKVAQALEMIASFANATVGDRQAVLAATARVAQIWDFADALHHALSEGCDDFLTLDATLARRALRGPKVSPTVVKL